MTTKINFRIREAIIGQVAKLADEFNVSQSHIWRGLIEQGAAVMKDKDSTPERLKKYYETIAQQLKITTIKEQTGLLRSNAYFVKRSAKMLRDTRMHNYEMANQLHELLLEEAEIRGIREEFIEKISSEIARVDELEKAKEDRPLL